MFLFDFLPEKWRIVHENPVSARIYHEVLKNLAENIGNFRRKASMVSIFGGGNPPIPSLIGKPVRVLGTRSPMRVPVPKNPGTHSDLP